MPRRRLPTLEELTADDDDVVKMLLDWNTFLPTNDVLTDKDIKKIISYYENAQDELDEY